MPHITLLFPTGIKTIPASMRGPLVVHRSYYHDQTGFHRTQYFYQITHRRSWYAALPPIDSLGKARRVRKMLMQTGIPWQSFSKLPKQYRRKVRRLTKVLEGARLITVDPYLHEALKD